MMKFFEQLNNKRQIVQAEKKEAEAYEKLSNAIEDYIYYVEEGNDRAEQYKGIVEVSLERYKLAKKEADDIRELRRIQREAVTKAALKLLVNGTLIVIAGNLEFEQGKLLPKFAPVNIRINGIEDM